MMCHKCVHLSPNFVTDVQLKVRPNIFFDIAPKAPWRGVQIEVYGVYRYILRILNCNEMFDIENI